MVRKLIGCPLLMLGLLLPNCATAAVTVSSVTELVNAVHNANTPAGDKTILIADSDDVYDMSGQALNIEADGVTIRSASGNREKVVLDSDYTQSGTSGVIRIVASNVTVADLTLQYQYYHAIHISASSRNISNVTVSNVHIIDPGEQAIKINADSLKNATYRVSNSLVADSLIELTDEGRNNLTNSTACYTGGVDAHWSPGLTVRDNVIRGFWCTDNLSEHGIHIWNHSDNALVERNLVIDCARGIGFGMWMGEGDRRGNNGGIIRNNMVYNSITFDMTDFTDVGINLEDVRDAQVYNNTVYNEHDYNAMEYRISYTQNCTIVNNLTNKAIRRRDIDPEEDTNDVSNNVTNAQPSWFTDVSSGDLHLSGTISSVVGMGQWVPGLTDDFDGDGRPQGNGYEIGADEIALNSPLPPSSDSAVLTWMLLLLQDN